MVPDWQDALMIFSFLKKPASNTADSSVLLFYTWHAKQILRRHRPRKADVSDQHGQHNRPKTALNELFPITKVMYLEPFLLTAPFIFHNEVTAEAENRKGDCKSWFQQNLRKHITRSIGI